MNLWDVKHANPRSQVGDFSAVASSARQAGGSNISGRFSVSRECGPRGLSTQGAEPDGRGYRVLELSPRGAPGASYVRRLPR